MTLSNKKIQPYGSWTSPISSSTIVKSGLGFGYLHLDQEILYWNEVRPCEGGRSSLLSWDGKKITELLSKPYSVRSQVHEYGGRAFTTSQETLYFSNDATQSFCACPAGGNVKELVTFSHRRYGNPVYDPKRNVIYAIEEVTYPGSTPWSRLVVIDVEKKNSVRTLWSGYDFFSSIALSPDQTQIAFLAWNHPSMPWDETTLFVGRILETGAITHVTKVAGGNHESIFQPKFAEDGTLFFISDRTSFWNLYSLESGIVTPCYPLKAEFGAPEWLFGLSRYDFIMIEDRIKIACCYTVMGQDHLAILDPKTQTLEEQALSFTTYREIHATHSKVYFLASSPQQGEAIYCYHLTSKELRLIRKGQRLEIDPDFISIPKTISYPTENENIAHGFYYPPKSKDFCGSASELPPLIVNCHGGPSDHVSPSFELGVQFWTSRGFAFFDVNYGGSTGYGRNYRERLKENWGVVDVADCCSGALYLVKKKLADPERLAIRGGSAGGFTTLATLAFKDVFKAGTSCFGVSDLMMLIQETHKFEAHYLDGLIGKFPEAKERYQYYSPIYHIKNINCPILFLQGDQDTIVPPNQSKKIFQALKKRGIPAMHILFKGEGHGFRKAETIQRFLDAELEFYLHIFQLKNPFILRQNS